MRAFARGDLQHAIQSGEIVPYYQPIVDMDSGLPTGFEILARWCSRTHGLVPPIEFIARAEDFGLLEVLTESIFAQAALDAADWPEDFSLWLNIAPCQLNNSSFVKRVSQIAGEAMFDLRNLVIEITEGTLLLNETKARCTANDLRASGIRLAIDDFGIGYSNFLRLRALPFDILKIDALYIGAISEQYTARCKVQSLLSSVLQMGLDTVAEGVEHEAEAEVVRDLGIKMGQGWLFGRPQQHPQVFSKPVTYDQSLSL